MASILNLPPKTNAGLPRVDGPLKVSGVAMYTSDHNLPGMLYAVPVCATIANGTITSIDSSRAEAMPGVKAVYTRQNIGKLFRTAPPRTSTGISMSAVRPSKTTPSATTDNTSPPLWRLPSNRRSPQPMRSR